MTVNSRIVRLFEKRCYIGGQMDCPGERFRTDQKFTLTSTENGDFAGRFIVPSRIFTQSATRNNGWPIPSTHDDSKTTWLAPERQLPFLELANGSDAIPLTAPLDDSPLNLKLAYRSVRPQAPSFVGCYADLPAIAPDKLRYLTKVSYRVMRETVVINNFDMVSEATKQTVRAVTQRTK